MQVAKARVLKGASVETERGVCACENSLAPGLLVVFQRSPTLNKYSADEIIEVGEFRTMPASG